MNMLPSLINMVVGNPLTSAPGVVVFLATVGPVTKALGESMIEIGAGGDFWTVLGTFFTKPEVASFGTSIGLIFSKDFNVTGGTKQR